MPYAERRRHAEVAVNVVAGHFFLVRYFFTSRGRYASLNLIFQKLLSSQILPRARARNVNNKKKILCHKLRTRENLDLVRGA